MTMLIFIYLSESKIETTYTTPRLFILIEKYQFTCGL